MCTAHKYSENWQSCTRVQHGALVLKGTRWFGSSLEMAHLAIYVRKSLCVCVKLILPLDFMQGWTRGVQEMLPE